MKDTLKMAGALALAMIVVNLAKNLLPLPAGVKSALS